MIMGKPSVLLLTMLFSLSDKARRTCCPTTLLVHLCLSNKIRLNQQNLCSLSWAIEGVRLKIMVESWTGL